MSAYAYDLFTVQIGTDKVPARPIGWDREDEDGAGNDKDGDPINAIRFETTCPTCSQLLTFDKIETYTATDESEDNIACSNCETGNPKMPTMEELLMNQESGTPFLDPIAENVMDVDNFDLELLKSIENRLD